MKGRVHLKALAALVTALSLILVIIWYGWLEPPWLTFRNLPWPIEDNVAGELLHPTTTRCSELDVESSYITSRYLVRVDQKQDDISIGADATTAQPGCHTTKTARFASPAKTPPGEYFYRGTAEIHGTWRKHSIAWRTQTFRVKVKEP